MNTPSALFLAFGDASNIFGPIMKVLGQISFVLAFIMVVGAGYKWSNHDHSGAKSTLIGVAILAGAGALLTWLFRGQGMPVVEFTQ